MFATNSSIFDISKLLEHQTDRWLQKLKYKICVYINYLYIYIHNCFNFSFQPRPNEAGGMFGNGIIVRKYEVNQVIKVRVELTANHMGYFEFRVCPNNALKKPASQMCLDKHILKQQNLNGPR